MTLSRKNRSKLRRAINTKLADLAAVVGKPDEDPPRVLPYDAAAAAVDAIDAMINSGQISITFHRNGGEKKS